MHVQIVLQGVWQDFVVNQTRDIIRDLQLLLQFILLLLISLDEGIVFSVDISENVEETLLFDFLDFGLSLLLLLNGLVGYVLSLVPVDFRALYVLSLLLLLVYQEFDFELFVGEMLII